MPNHGDRSFDFRRCKSGKRSRPVVRGKYGLYGYHTFQFEPLDQWINGYRETVNANFKAIDSHGTVSWIRFLHQRMLLMNRTIEILCLQKRGKVKLEIPIPQQLPFPSKTAPEKEFMGRL
jgi:hypothetical protein